MKGTLYTIKTTVQYPSDIVVLELTAPPERDTLTPDIPLGYLQLIPGFETFDGERCVAFCHEEGKLQKLPFNPIATALWVISLKRHIMNDYLAGTVVVITGDDELLASL